MLVSIAVEQPSGETAEPACPAESPPEATLDVVSPMSEEIVEALVASPAVANPNSAPSDISEPSASSPSASPEQTVDAAPEPPAASAAPEEPIITEEQRLRELVKQRMKTKTQGGDDSAVAKQERTNFLRIDNFQRPLNNRSLKQWLIEILGTPFEDEDIWLNAIKTHCYVDFPSVDAAAAAIERLKGHRWPSSNPRILEANFTSISAKDAPTSQEAGLRSDQWRVVVKKIVNPVESVASDSGKTYESVLGKRKPDIAPAGPGALSMFKHAMADAGGAGATASSSRERASLHRLEGSTETGFSTRRNREGGHQDTGRQRQFGLDDLFRKTTVKPQLYWLPLSEEEVERMKAAKAARMEVDIR